MKRIFKYWVVPISIFLFLLAFTVSLLPTLVNLEEYSTKIEKYLSESTGRTVTLGADMSVSFLPWLSFNVSDVSIGNPVGFQSDYFAKFETFEARIRILPLFKKELQFSRFVIGGLDLNLEINTDEKKNWHVVSKVELNEQDSSEPIDEKWQFPGSLSMSLFVVTDGEIRFRDRNADTSHSVDDLMILLTDFNIHEFSSFEGKGVLDGKPLEFDGSVAPLFRGGEDTFEKIDLAVTVFSNIKLQLNGSVNHLFSEPQYNFKLHLPAFSPEEFFAAAHSPFLHTNSGLRQIDNLEIFADVSGNLKQVTVNNGRASFDQSKVEFSSVYNRGEASKLKLLAHVDFLQIDKYLPENYFQMIGQNEKLSHATRSQFSPISKGFEMSGSLVCDTLRVGNLTAKKLTIPIQSVDGIHFLFDPMSFELYGGNAKASLSIDSSTRKSHLGAEFEGAQVKSFFKDVAQTESVTGQLSGTLALDLVGSNKDSLLKNLMGQGTLKFKNGELSGTGLDTLLSDSKGEEPKEEVVGNTQIIKYSEIDSKITINGGVLDTRESTVYVDSGRMTLTGAVNLSNSDYALQILPPGPNSITENGASEEFARPALMITGNLNGSHEVQVDSLSSFASSLKLPNEVDVQTLVDEKMPSPEDDDVKDLQGKALVDPAIVAQRFRLHPELLRKSKMKKYRSLGSGKVYINKLVEETSL